MILLFLVFVKYYIAEIIKSINAVLLKLREINC